MMTLSDLMSFPEVEPCDLSATLGGVNHDIDLRTKAEIRQQRAFDGQVEAIKRVHKYQAWPLTSIGHGHILSDLEKPQQEQHYPGGVQNMDMPVKRLGGLRLVMRFVTFGVLR